MPAPKLTPVARRYWLPWFFLALLNFFVFAYVAHEIGGDAINGSHENGRYYVANHGVKTEVTKSMYYYSYIHTVSVWITHGLALGGALVLLACGKLYETSSNETLNEMQRQLKSKSEDAAKH